MSKGDDLGHKAARGAFVTVSGQGVRLVVQTAGIAIMARLLDPTDYGLLGMAAVLIALGEVFREFGLGAAAIQAKILTDGQRDNLFWANTGLGLGLFGLAQLAAMPLAAFFDQPALIEITRYVALIFVFNGISAQYRAQLTRHLRFFALTMSEVVGQIVGLTVGISTALAGWGYWALVAMQITQAAVTMFLLVFASGWLPGWIQKGQQMRPFWSYGGHLLGSQLVGYAANNVDSVVIGYRLGPAQLGIYDRAYRLVTVPLSQMRAPTTTVALPTLSKMREDQKRYDRTLLAGQVALGYTFVPLLMVLAAAHDPIVAIMLGPDWSEAAPVLGLFAVAGALQLMSYVGYWVYLSRGLTKALFQYSLISASVRISAILVGSSWGTVGVAAGVVVSSVLLWPVSLWWLSRRVELPVRGLLIGGFRLLGLAAIAGIAALAALTLVAVENDFVLVAVTCFVVFATYAAAWAVPVFRRDEQLVIRIAKSARKGKLDLDA